MRHWRKHLGRIALALAILGVAILVLNASPTFRTHHWVARVYEGCEGFALVGGFVAARTKWGRLAVCVVFGHLGLLVLLIAFV